MQVLVHAQKKKSCMSTQRKAGSDLKQHVLQSLWQQLCGFCQHHLSEQMGPAAALVLVFLLNCGRSHALGHVQHTEYMRTQHDEGGLPVNHCGSWQAEYTKLHGDILAGRAPQRYAIANTWSGLADAQIGAVSVFYYALLTGRAFVWAYEHLEAAYDKPNINWSWPWEERSEAEQTDSNVLAGFHTGQSTKRLPPGINSTHYVLYQNCKATGNTADVVWRTTDINKLGEDYQHVYFNSNRGLLNMLFVNPHHEQALQRMGIRPDTAFGCAMNYLVTLRNDVALQHQEAVQQLSRPDVLRIGVQIRNGDDFMVGGNKTLPSFDAFFKCAAEIEATRGKAYPGGVVWYLISDSIAVRRQARQSFGDKVIDTTLHGHVGHVADKAFRAQHMSAESTMVQACAENWLLGMTDVQVISKRSGFGRTAAFRSLRWHNIYTIDPPVNGVFPNRRCGLDNFDSVDIVGRHWSHIRKVSL